jgi:hypothetical protein
MNKKLKTAQAIFKMHNEVRCFCGRNLTILSSDQYNNRYVLLSVIEEGREHLGSAHALYDTKLNTIVPKGTFSTNSKNVIFKAKEMITEYESRQSNETI